MVRSLFRAGDLGEHGGFAGSARTQMNQIATREPERRAPARLAKSVRAEWELGAPRGVPRGFSATDLLVLLAIASVLVAIALPMIVRARSQTRLAQCIANLQQINRAVLLYAEDHKETLPFLASSPAPGPWWYYKEQVKGYLNLSGPASPNETVFGCPSDRGYGEGTETLVPFRTSKKHNFTSYNLNSVNLPGMPNIAGWKVSAVKEPSRTLLTMEWTAHAPLSWHRSRTGKANTPFYNDAESVVGFVDGHVNFIPIYYDGMNAAYTRDPLAGYQYKYSGD
jgi:competence protein ComGC